MKLNVYIASLERAARNLPGLLARWSSIPAELQDHYSEEVAWLLAEREDALAAARRQGRWAWVENIVKAELQLRAIITLYGEQLGLGASDADVYDGVTTSVESAGEPEPPNNVDLPSAA